MGPRVVDRGLERGRVARVREGHVDDVGAVIDGPDDALDDVAVLAEAVRVEDGDGHDLDAGEADARDAGAVVGLGGDDPGHRGAVAVRIARSGRSRRGTTCRRRALPSRSGWEASTPVSRTATTAVPAGVTVAVDVGPSRSSAATTGRNQWCRPGSPRRRDCGRARPHVTAGSAVGPRPHPSRRASSTACIREPRWCRVVIAASQRPGPPPCSASERAGLAKVTTYDGFPAQG